MVQPSPAIRSATSRFLSSVLSLPRPLTSASSPRGALSRFIKTSPTAGPRVCGIAIRARRQDLVHRAFWSRVLCHQAVFDHNVMTAGVAWIESELSETKKKRKVLVIISALYGALYVDIVGSMDGQ